jgi:dTDP-4-amino-4,6-dideoxygalactose transaminase
MGRGPGSFPVAQASASREVSLPMFAELTTERIRTVAAEPKHTL